MLNVFDHARCCIEAADIEEKLHLTHAAGAALAAGRLDFTPPATPPEPIGAPGRPARPRLVEPSRLPPRKLATPGGRAAFLHALAHIEFNAINLAWDAVYRFRDMPEAYHVDWLAVADDEARHFRLLRGRLLDLGHDYGDFPGHDGLWSMATCTAGDVLARMAIVPRVLEARGLDVTPGMIARLDRHGDPRSARVLEEILHDEIGHVAAGSRWFRHVCRRRGLEPLAAFRELLDHYLPRRMVNVLNRDARLQAGFHMAELDMLEATAGVTS
jgi:uncharacterized ferritin-like protein (DUF455 family)